MKKHNDISIYDQVQDMLDLINLLSGTHYVRLYDAMKDLPEVTKMLKKLNQHQRYNLLKRINDLM